MRSRKPGNNDGLGESGVSRQANCCVVNAEKKNRKDEIDSRAGGRDERALPTLFGHEFVGSAGGFLIAGVNIGKVLPGHANVATERKGAEAPVGVATLEAEETWAEADGEDVDTNAEEAGDDVMSPFVNEDNHTENQDHADNCVHSSKRLRQTPIVAKSRDSAEWRCEAVCRELQVVQELDAGRGERVAGAGGWELVGRVPVGRKQGQEIKSRRVQAWWVVSSSCENGVRLASAPPQRGPSRWRPREREGRATPVGMAGFFFRDKVQRTKRDPSLRGLRPE